MLLEALAGCAMSASSALHNAKRHLVRFDCYEADLDSGELRKRGIRLRLRDQSFQVLAVLLQHPGEVITREELRQRLWRDEVFVDFEKSLNTAVARLREALADSAAHPRFVETVPKRGYRFVADIFTPAPAAAEPKTSRARLIVLPLVNLSGDPAQDYFSDAMTEEIITALAGVAPEQLAVIARTTAMHYKGTHKDVAHIGRELNVGYAVEGGVRRTEKEVGINVQLIDTTDQSHLFAKRYDSELLDAFSVRGRIAQEVAAHIPAIARDAHGAVASARSMRKPTDDILAYNAYMQGRYYVRRWTPECIAKAKDCFELAIARDPEFAQAHAALAELYGWMGWLGFMDPKDVFPSGVWAAMRALEIDNTVAQAHAWLGLFRKEHDCNWAEVHRAVTRAVELDPTSPEIRFWYAGAYLLPLGRIEDAVAEVEAALEIDPLSVFLRSWLGLMFDFGRQYDKGLKEAKLAIELDSSAYIPHFVLGHLYRDKGMFEESIAAHRVAVERSGDAPLMLGWLGLSIGLSGNSVEARSLLEHLQRVANCIYVPPSAFAWIHLGLGEVDEAFLWMGRAIGAHDPMMTPIKTYAFLDPFRRDPRFADLLRKMNLAS